MTDPVTNEACPYCQRRTITTVRNVPFYRGYLLVFQHGSRRFAGCVPCVRKKMLAETAKAVGFGWFSPKALVATVLVTPVTFGRALMLREDPKAVTALLDSLGVPTMQHEQRLRDAMYNAAAAIVKADGEAHPAEVELAAEYLRVLVPGFEQRVFDNHIAQSKGIGTVEQPAMLLSRYLTPEGRQTMLEMAAAIILADGTIDKRERKQWQRFATALGLSKDQAENQWKSLVEVDATAGSAG